MQRPTVRVSLALVFFLLPSLRLLANSLSCPTQLSAPNEQKETGVSEPSRASLIMAKEAYEEAKQALSQSLVEIPPLVEPPPKKIVTVYPPIIKEKNWCAKSGGTLQQSLDIWAKIANWGLQWHSDYDYPILADFCFTGTFERAMEEVIDAYKEAEHPLYLDIYPQQQLTVITH